MVAVPVMVGLAALSAQIGLAAIIGAFLAGMVFAELREQYELERQTLPLYELLVPLFFVIPGSRVDWRLFFDVPLMGLALAVTVLAIVGKLAGRGVGAWGLGGGRWHAPCHHEPGPAGSASVNPDRSGVVIGEWGDDRERS